MLLKRRSKFDMLAAKLAIQASVSRMAFYMHISSTLHSSLSNILSKVFSSDCETPYHYYACAMDTVAVLEHISQRMSLRKCDYLRSLCAYT